MNKLLNARGETVAEKPSFRDAFRKRRCLIVADGYYEWIKRDGTKIPVYIRLKSQKPFGLAGLWEVWRDELKTCTIITTESNELIRPFHHRMHVIVPTEKHMEWVDPENRDADRLRLFLTPYTSDEMEYFRVSPYINSSKHNSPDCIRRVE